MPRIRRFFALLPALLALGLLAVAPLGALAAPTDKKTDDNVLVFNIHEVDDVDPTACGFPLLVHVDGFVKIRFPRNGQQGVIEVDSIHIKLLWENPANHKTSDVTEGFTQKVVDNGDGTITIVITGLQGRDTIPGAGRVTGDIGRLVLTFDPATSTVTQVFQAGPQSNGPFPALCQYLA